MDGWMDGIVEMWNGWSVVGFEWESKMCLGRKENVDLECVGCWNDLETWTEQSRTRNQTTLVDNNNNRVLWVDSWNKDRKKESVFRVSWLV